MQDLHAEGHSAEKNATCETAVATGSCATSDLTADPRWAVCPSAISIKRERKLLQECMMEMEGITTCDIGRIAPTHHNSTQQKEEKNHDWLEILVFAIWGEFIEETVDTIQLERDELCKPRISEGTMRSMNMQGMGEGAEPLATADL